MPAGSEWLLDGLDFRVHRGPGGRYHGIDLYEAFRQKVLQISKQRNGFHLFICYPFADRGRNGTAFCHHRTCRLSILSDMAGGGSCFLLIQNALVCRGAYLHGAGKVSAGLGAVGGMLGIASARVIGLLFSRGTILSVVILGFSALLGMVGTQYFLKIYYLKRFSLPDHI